MMKPSAIVSGRVLDQDSEEWKKLSEQWDEEYLQPKRIANWMRSRGIKPPRRLPLPTPDEKPPANEGNP
jgi:hypothetical protein